MKGQASGGGITIFNILLFYSVFLLFVSYIGANAGVTIVTVEGNPNSIPLPTSSLDLAGLFNFFVAFLGTNTTFQLLSIILVTPFVIMMGYAILQLIRGTG
jgi:hypothetical protein